MAASGSSPGTDRVFRFGPYEVAEAEGELRKHGVRIKVQEQPFRVLVELVANAGKVVSREELHQRLWTADTFVDFDTGLNTAIRKLRQALNDDADKPRYIETLARRGYRFLGTVALADAEAAQPAANPGPALEPIPQAVVSPSVTQAASSNRVRYVVAALLLVAAVVGAGSTYWKSRRPQKPYATEVRVTTNPSEAPLTSAVISPDGKFVAYSDSTGLYLRHIDSGEIRQLELPADFQALPTGWFPDSGHLLLTGLEHGNDSTDIWKISILGGRPQKLLERATGGAISPDGSKIAFFRAREKSLDLWVANSDGQSAKSLVTEVGDALATSTSSWISSPLYLGMFAPALAWAPDGHRIAFIRTFGTFYFEDAPGHASRLETTDVDSPAPKLVRESEVLRPALAWAPDGRLFFTERERVDPSRRGDMGVWFVRVGERSGAAEGKAVPVTVGAGRIGGLSISADGKRLLLWRANTQPQLYLTEMNAEGERFNPPRRVTMDDQSNYGGAWTPDGGAVLLGSERGGKWKLYRQRIDKATSAAELLIDSSVGNVRMGPDDDHIFYIVADPSDPTFVDLTSLALAGGSPELILRIKDFYNQQCSRGPKAVCVYSTFYRDRSSKFFKFDPVTRKPEEFLSFPPVKEAVNWSFSPDGSTLALVFTGDKAKVRFYELGSGATHDVELPEWASVNNVDWRANSQSVLAIAQSPAGTSAVLEIEPSGKYAVRLEGDRNVRYFWAIPSPDGKRVALEMLTGENNAWLIENF